MVLAVTQHRISHNAPKLCKLTCRAILGLQGIVYFITVIVQSYFCSRGTWGLEALWFTFKSFALAWLELATNFRALVSGVHNVTGGVKTFEK